VITLKRFSDWLYHVFTGKVAWISLVIGLFISALILSGAVVPETLRCSLDPAKPRTCIPFFGNDSLQKCFYYSADELKGFRDAYGQTGRECFVRFTLTFDSALPLALALCFVSALSSLCGKAFASTSKWWWVNLVPIVGMLFDYLENFSNVIFMLPYPPAEPIVATLSGFFTMFKWSFVIVNGILLLFGLGVCVRRFITRPHSQK